MGAPAAELSSEAEADRGILGQVVAGWARPDGSTAHGVFATAVDDTHLGAQAPRRGW
jgi:hypothetical protein